MRAELGTPRAFGRTGLGLTISRQLCQLLGDRLDLHSEVGQESTLSISLRAA